MDQISGSSKNTLWSIVPEIQVSKKGIEKWGPNTTVIEKNADGVVVVRKSNNQEYSLHKEYFSEVNVPLNDRELLTGLWQEVSIRLYSRYYANWLGFEQERGRLSVADIIPVTKAAISKILRRKNRDKDQFLLRYHLFACESHRNAIATALGVLGGEQDDLRTETTREIADRVMP